jgi:hypothetical protein
MAEKDTAQGDYYEFDASHKSRSGYEEEYEAKFSSLLPLLHVLRKPL